MRLGFFRILFTYQCFPLLSCATALLAHKGFITSLVTFVSIATMALAHSYIIKAITDHITHQLHEAAPLKGEHNVN